MQRVEDQRTGQLYVVSVACISGQAYPWTPRARSASASSIRPTQASERNDQKRSSSTGMRAMTFEQRSPPGSPPLQRPVGRTACARPRFDGDRSERRTNSHTTPSSNLSSCCYTRLHSRFYLFPSGQRGFGTLVMITHRTEYLGLYCWAMTISQHSIRSSVSLRFRCRWSIELIQLVCAEAGAPRVS